MEKHELGFKTFNLGTLPQCTNMICKYYDNDCNYVHIESEVLVPKLEGIMERSGKVNIMLRMICHSFESTRLTKKILKEKIYRKEYDLNLPDPCGNDKIIEENGKQIAEIKNKFRVDIMEVFGFMGMDCEDDEYCKANKIFEYTWNKNISFVSGLLSILGEFESLVDLYKRLGVI